jgi:hypothetical protein
VGSTKVIIGHRCCPGSAQARLADALGTREIGASEKAGQ